jgi:hypothetical protein
MSNASLDRLGIWVNVKFLLYQFPRNSRHVSRLPCKGIPISLEQFDEHKFLFGVQTVPRMSDLSGLIQGQWNSLAEVVLRLDGHLGCHGLRHDRVRVGLDQGHLQLLEFRGCQKPVCHLTALPVTVVSVFYIPSDGDDAIWTRHLQNQVGIGRNCHEPSECRPPEECILCHFEISYLKLHILGSKVFLSPKGHGKSNLANGGRCAQGTIPWKGA